MPWQLQEEEIQHEQPLSFSSSSPTNSYHSRTPKLTALGKERDNGVCLTAMEDVLHFVGAVHGEVVDPQSAMTMHIGIENGHLET